MTASKCRAKGGPANCTNPNCPDKRAIQKDVFSGPACGGFGEPTGIPFYDLTASSHFRQVAKDAIDSALTVYPARNQDWEAISHVTAHLREAYPEESQAIHMMN